MAATCNEGDQDTFQTTPVSEHILVNELLLDIMLPWSCLSLQCEAELGHGVCALAMCLRWMKGCFFGTISRDTILHDIAKLVLSPFVISTARADGEIPSDYCLELPSEYYPPQGSTAQQW